MHLDGRADELNRFSEHWPGNGVVRSHRTIRLSSPGFATTRLPRIRRGQPQHELASRSDTLAMRREIAIVQTRQPSRKREPETQPAPNHRRVSLDTDMAVEDSRQHLARDADARIAHCDLDRRSLPVERQPDVAASLGELGRIDQ